MFNIGPMEMLVLAAVALIVFGPDKLPQLTKDAARMLRTLRDLAQGARTQLNDELGPDFADFDLSSLNPRTAIKNALLGDEDLPSFKPGQFKPREAFERLMNDDAPSLSKSGAPESPADASSLSKSTPAPNQPTTAEAAYESNLPTRWDDDAT